MKSKFIALMVEWGFTKKFARQQWDFVSDGDFTTNAHDSACQAWIQVGGHV